MAIVPVPEAPMHEDHRPILRQAHIRITRKVLAMNPVAKTARVKRLANGQFGLGVLASNAGHHPAAGYRVDNVSQPSPCAWPPTP